MKISRSENTFFLEVSKTELVTISNCINDATDLMGEDEFHARVGAEKEEAWRIIEQIVKFLRENGSS